MITFHVCGQSIILSSTVTFNTGILLCTHAQYSLKQNIKIIDSSNILVVKLNINLVRAMATSIQVRAQ